MTPVVLAEPHDGESAVQAALRHAPDVLRATGDGYSAADIAARLHVAEGTVRNYLSNAMQKTQTRTRHEAARYAREHDWL
ncbi:regulatory protein, luxR family [Streptomyces sp. cf386]|nr:regulatory protein, luxR family [Streptomyces sp. cf386]